MKIGLMLLAISALVACYPAAMCAQDPHAPQTHGLTVEDILSLVQHGIPADQVIGLIQRNPSYFELSLQTIDNLKRAGVPPTVIDAMLESRGNAPSVQTNPPLPEPSRPNDISPPPNIHPAPVKAGSAGPTSRQTNGPITTGRDSGSQAPANSAARFQEAKSVQIPPHPWLQPTRQADPGCPITTHGKLNIVDLDYDSGSSSASRLGRSGMYCFALRNANPLYDWLVTLNVSEPTGNPFDLLNDAIQTLTKLSTGASSAKPTPSPGKEFAKGVCPDLSDVTQKATALKQALAGMVPRKDNNGKVAYISLQKTQKDWQAVPEAFSNFEHAVNVLVSSLPDSPDPSCDSILQQAESIIVDDYPKLLAQYHELSDRLAKPGVIYYEQPLEATATADLVATPSYAGTADGSKTFHFNPSFGILSSSAGFLLTELPARSYTSATAPDLSDPTKTQNVLKVDYGAGIRPALTVLLTGNVPQVNSRNFGLGVSAGPVFDVSNGKADTSRFGFFGGVSVRLTPWIFLTPGVHVGEFADFPQGFTHSGQLIPPNTGTPVATKRYTARFAFAVTFKLKDLGASTGGDQTKAQGAPSAQPAAGGKQ
jgi:hypothetical protein